MVAQNFALNLTSLGLERKTSDNETPKWTSPPKKDMSFYHPVNRGTPLLILSQPLQHEPRKCYKVSEESKSSRWTHEVWGKPVDRVYIKPHANSSEPAKLGARLLYNQMPYLNVQCWSQWLEMSQNDAAAGKQALFWQLAINVRWGYGVLDGIDPCLTSGLEPNTCQIWKGITQPYISLILSSHPAHLWLRTDGMSRCMISAMYWL